MLGQLLELQHRHLGVGFGGRVVLRRGKERVTVDNGSGGVVADNGTNVGTEGMEKGHFGALLRRSAGTNTQKKR